MRIIMDKTQNILFDLESLSQLVVVNDDIYVTKSQLRETENDIHHGVYRVFNQQLDLIADDAWLPQNSYGYLAYLKNINHKPQVFINGHQVTNNADGVTHFLTSENSDSFYYLSVQIHNPAIPDSKTFPIPRRITKQMYKADGYGLVDEQAIYNIYYVNVHDKTEQLIVSTSQRTALLSQNEDASQIIVTQTADINGLSSQNKALILTKNGKLLSITNNLPEGFVHDAIYSPDGRYIALVAHDHLYTGARIFSIYLYDVSSRQLVKLFNQDIDAVQSTMSDIQYKKSAHGLHWLDYTTLEFIATYRGHNRIYRLTVTGEVTLISDKKRAVLSLTKNYLIESTTEIPSRILTRSGKIIYEPIYHESFTEGQKFTFESEDGSLVDSWFMKASSEGVAPVVLYIHGGPHAAYSDAFFWEFQQFNQKGYHVLFINPHGSTSYGQKFVNSVVGNYGTIDYNDVLKGLTVAQDKFSDIIDNEKTFLAGGSYGGFLTTWIIGHDQRFRAAVAQRPVINWISLFGTSDIGVDFTTSELKLDLSTENNIIELWRLSPLSYAKYVSTPILLLHGEYDLRTPLSQSEEYFSAIKAQTSTPVELVRWPQSFHGMSRTGKPNLRLARLTTMFEWFQRFS